MATFPVNLTDTQDGREWPATAYVTVEHKRGKTWWGVTRYIVWKDRVDGIILMDYNEWQPSRRTRRPVPVEEIRRRSETLFREWMGSHNYDWAIHEAYRMAAPAQIASGGR